MNQTLTSAWRFSIQVATQWEKAFFADPHTKHSQKLPYAAP